MSFLTLLAAIAPAVSFPWTPDPSGRTQFELWVDPYYTAVNGTRALTDEPIPHLDTQEEGGVYSWLMSRLLTPRDLLVEASVNPLPTGGWVLRSYAPDAYQNATLGEFNLVQSITTGFPEPWAISVFLGNVVNLVTGSDTSKVNGVGYSGLLVSWGAWHLVENRMIRDDWLESEVKLKGDDIQVHRKLSWSFRLGWREHFNPAIHDAIYVSVARKRTDFLVSGWDPLRNASIEARIDFDRAELPEPRPMRWTAIVGKKFPAPSGKWAFSMSTGVQSELSSEYDGALKSAAPRGFTFLLRPNVEW